MAIRHSATGGSAIGAGRLGSGLISTGACSWARVTLPSYTVDAAGVCLVTGGALVGPWAAEDLVGVSLPPGRCRSPLNHRKPTPQASTSATTMTAVPSFSRTGTR